MPMAETMQMNTPKPKISIVDFRRFRGKLRNFLFNKWKKAYKYERERRKNFGKNERKIKRISRFFFELLFF